MNVEILNFYEMKRDDTDFFLNGTMHIRLPDLDIEIRGVYVVRNKDRLFVHLPSRTGFDQVTGDKVKYPIFAFGDRQKTFEFIQAIKEKAAPFVEDYLKSHPEPVVAPKPVEQVKPQVKLQECKEGPLAQSTPTPKPMISASASCGPRKPMPSDFRDPPARKCTMRQFATPRR